MSGLDLYHRSPYPVRCAVASVRGYYLRSWRYGRSTDSLVAKAMERERWAPEQWARWQASRLREVLERAANDVAHYRESTIPDGSAEPAGLQSWPILTKADVRGNADSFIAKGRPRLMFAEHTSGTSGTPLELRIRRADYVEWYALAEARWRRWHGVSRRDKWGILGGQLVVAPGATQPPFWVWNSALRQLYLSSYHLSPLTAVAYGSAIDAHRLRYLVGYPSALYALAQGLVGAGSRPQALKVVITNAEPLLDHQRELIAEVFQCPVRDTYGMAEFLLAASECEMGRMHLWPEVGMLEVLDERGRAVEPGEVGRLVATSLLNRDMPLIRYDTGDTGALEPADARCGCGRLLPLLRSVEGRTDDLVITADGRRIGRLDPVFKADLPISEAQIVQEEIGVFRILVVPNVGFTNADAAALSDRLLERVGPAAVAVESVESIPRTKGSKFKAVVSRVPLSEYPTD